MMPKRKTFGGCTPSAGIATTTPACSAKRAPKGFVQSKHLRTEYGCKRMVRMTIIVGDTTVPVPYPAQPPARLNIMPTPAGQEAEDQSHRAAMKQACLSALSKAGNELDQAEDYANRAKRSAIGAAVRATRLGDQLLDAESFAAEDKEEAEKSMVAATEARAAFKAADGAWTAAQLALTSHQEKVDAAKYHYEGILTDLNKAADQVGEEDHQDILRAKVKLTTIVGMAERRREDMKNNIHSLLAVDPNFDHIFDRNVRNPDFLALHDEYLAELSPHDIAAVWAKGMEAAGAMSSATASAVAEGKAKLEPGVRVYIPSVTEADILAMLEEQVVRQAVKLEALERRRCARQDVIAALSLAAEQSARDLNEARAGLVSTDATCSKAAGRAVAALANLVLAETAEATSDREGREAAANVRSLQQRQVDAVMEQESLEAAARQAKEALNEAASAMEFAELEHSMYCHQPR